MAGNCRQGSLVVCLDLFGRHYLALFRVIIGQIRFFVMEHPIKQPIKTSGESTVPHLLVVDEDLDLCEVLESYLRGDAFAGAVANGGKLRRRAAQPPRY